MTTSILDNLKLNDMKDIKIIFNRIKNDNRNLQVSILWKQDSEIRNLDNVSVYAEIEGYTRRSLELTRLDNSDLWYATLKIKSSLSEIATFDKKLAVKLVEYKVKSYKPSYSYAF
jgi:hypothetical protein